MGANFMCRLAGIPGSAGQLAAGSTSICPASTGHFGRCRPSAPSRSVNAWPLQTDALDPQPGPGAAFCVPAHPWAACPCRWRNGCAGGVSKPCRLHERAVPLCKHGSGAAATCQPCLRPTGWHEVIPRCGRSHCAAATGKPCLPCTGVADSSHCAGVATLPVINSPQRAARSSYVQGIPHYPCLCAASTCWPGVISSRWHVTSRAVSECSKWRSSGYTQQALANVGAHCSFGEYGAWLTRQTVLTVHVCSTGQPESPSGGRRGAEAVWLSGVPSWRGAQRRRLCHKSCRGR